MRVFMLGIAVTVAALMPTVCMADDQQIADFVKSRLQLEQQRGNLQGFNVDMRVDKGTVWFKGFVSNRDQEQLILRTAQQAGHLGVVQVVDDIEVNSPRVPTMAPAPVAQTTYPNQMLRQQQAMFQQANEKTAQQQRYGNAQGNQVGYQEPILMADPLRRPAMMQPAPQQPVYQAPPVPQQPMFQQPPAYSDTGYQGAMVQPSMPQMTTPGVPTRSISRSNQPLAFASAGIGGAECYGGQGCGCDSGVYGGDYGAMAGDMGPTPMGSDNGVAGGMPMESANLPGYAWPGYAASPNYGAVSYPQQYSPSAWPYIGPFYPYPQVPLGWRKVALEWDDGWWYLDFNDKPRN